MINAILGQLKKKKKKEFQILALHKFFDIKKKEKKKKNLCKFHCTKICGGLFWVYLKVAC